MREFFFQLDFMNIFAQIYRLFLKGCEPMGRQLPLVAHFMDPIVSLPFPPQSTPTSLTDLPSVHSLPSKNFFSKLGKSFNNHEES